MDISANDSSFLNHCFDSIPSKYMVTGWYVVYLLFLPVFIFVLYLGYKQQKTRPVSHSDVFTFNMAALELISIVFSSLFCYGFYSGPSVWAEIGASALSLSLVGQSLFHGLTCVERYLAVVHPITYLRLKRGGGVRIRNICIVTAWLLSFGNTCLSNVQSFAYIFKLSASMILCFFSITVVTFCSVSVLCVLIRPGPGDRKKIDQSKRAAFQMILTIQGVLLLRFCVSTINTGLFFVVYYGCALVASGLWFCLPSSLVLPLLFLDRAGKLTCFKKRK